MFSPSPFSRPPLRSRAADGMALLMVLSVLLLVSVLIVGFFLTTSAELKSSQSYASGTSVRQLADSATQLVIAQIGDATQGKTEDGDLLAWASQPGMIRTYDQEGDPFKYFKLYSSDTLILKDADAGEFDPADELPPKEWDTMRGLFVDLNRPIIRDNRVHFPIIDPRASAAPPAQGVEGFSYRADQVNGVVTPSGTADEQRLPMPVRWLYVLQNGKLATPVSSSGGVVSFDDSVPENVPSRENPIVGRIAFWTDDESSKINVNTASEGTFWDRPWANNTTEQNFATAIPARNEFQRFPGHPAKTSLSGVFGGILPSPSPVWYAGITSAQMEANQDRLAAYYELAPRIGDGGTRGGTVTQKNQSGATNSAFKPIPAVGDRLYASVDEFLFSPAYATAPGNETIREPNHAGIDNAFLEKTRFFLTAHSRAPEINLFGRPRMTLWPLQNDPQMRNAKDRLIAFCSEIGAKPYYFQRYNTYSAANPAAASSQSATLDWTGVPRNQELYSYLRRLTGEKVPGFGGSFATKYPDTRDQILTGMFDQIRSGVNAYSTALAPAYSYAPPYLESGAGQVVPLRPPAGTPGANTHGYGRFVTVVGAAIVFHRNNAAYFSKDSAENVVVDPDLITPENPNGIVIQPAARVGATLILNPFTASPGFPPWSPHVQYVITGLDRFTINGENLGFPAVLKNTVNSRIEYSGQANTGPFFGILANFRYNGGAAGDINKTAGTADPVTQYPFTIAPQAGVTLADHATSFDFNTDSAQGHTITITIYSGSDTALANPIQSIDMTFPPAQKLPVPTLHPTEAESLPTTIPVSRYFDRFGEGTNPTQTLNKPWRQRMIQFYPIPSTKPPYANAYEELGNDPDGNPVVYWVRDVARGVEATASGAAQGDYRAYAALNHVPATFFAPCAGYDELESGRQRYTNVQSLWDAGMDGGGTGGFGYDASVPGGYYPHFPMNQGGSSNERGGQLTTSFSTGVLIERNQLAAYGGVSGRGSNTGDREYRGSARPAVPSGLQGAFLDTAKTVPGDWDNLTGLLGDGPFINKPDEGNSETVSDTTSRTNIDVYLGGKDIGGGYFSTGVSLTREYQTESGETFSPNRQIASAVAFGSLPTGIDPADATKISPWKTLLFSPNPPGKSAHPGAASPPDHLFLDLFTMPIVEPYAISEPFSTAGRINMNYQILPFSYIRRSTGVRAVLKATRLMAIPQSVSTVTSAGNSYKDGLRSPFEFRYDVNAEETDGTLAGFEERFSDGDLFRSASEIATLFLVPKPAAPLSTGMKYPPGSTAPASYQATADWWDNFRLTGDNTRESPYSDLYARLTTKSNIYTVHYKVQSLKKSNATPAAQWVEGRDNVSAEARGSVTIERYIDIADPDLPDFAADSTPSAEEFYRFRTIRSTVFNP